MCNLCFCFCSKADLATLSLQMVVNREDYGLQMALDALHNTSELRCLQILRNLSYPLKKEITEPMRWSEDFKSNDFKLQIQIIYAYTKHLIQSDNRYHEKVTYSFCIKLLKFLSGHKVMIEKRVFAKEVLQSLQLLSKDYSMESSRISEATHLASMSFQMKAYGSLFEESLKESRTASRGDGDGKTRRRSSQTGNST